MNSREHITLRKMVESLSPNDKSILLIKPHCIEERIYGRRFAEITEALVTATRQDIIAICESKLTTEDVYLIHPILLTESRYGEEWKDKVVKHMTSGKVVSYMISGKNCYDKTMTIKRHIRTTLSKPLEDGSFNYLFNYLHSVDKEDFETSFNVLFRKPTLTNKNA